MLGKNTVHDLISLQSGPITSLLKNISVVDLAKKSLALEVKCLGGQVLGLGLEGQVLGFEVHLDKLSNKI